MPEHRLLLRDIDIPDIEQIDVYAAHGGYGAAERVVAEMAPQEVVDEVERAGLTGRGGAWQPVAPKWRAMPQPTAAAANYLCVNANESEPGTFRDRKLIERNPHQIVEGVIIAAYAIGARTAYIYVRDGMARGVKLLEDAIAAALSRRRHRRDRVLSLSATPQRWPGRGPNRPKIDKETTHAHRWREGTPTRRDAASAPSQR